MQNFARIIQPGFLINAEISSTRSRELLAESALSISFRLH